MPQAQTITIHDNDQPTAPLVATDTSATEAAGNSGIFTITRTGGNPYLALTVDYALAGRAVHGVDYRRLDGRATIPAGASSTTVEIQPYDDTVDEGTQDVTSLNLPITIHPDLLPEPAEAIAVQLYNPTGGHEQELALFHSTR